MFPDTPDLLLSCRFKSEWFACYLGSLLKFRNEFVAFWLAIANNSHVIGFRMYSTDDASKFGSQKLQIAHPRACKLKYSINDEDNEIKKKTSTALARVETS